MSVLDISIVLLNVLSIILSVTAGTSNPWVVFSAIFVGATLSHAATKWWYRYD